MAQLVARTAGGREVAGSSPVTPTIDKRAAIQYNFLIVTGNSIATAERHIINSSTNVLGGVLLTRTGIVVDFDENPAPYEYTYRTVDDDYAIEADTPAEDVAEAVVRSVRAVIPFDTYEDRKSVV